MITIRKAESREDIRLIAEIADVIWHEYFPALLTADQIDYMVEKFQSYDALVRAVEDEGYIYYMAYDGGDLCGYLGVRDEGGGTVFISKVYVRKDKRRRGIASALLGRLREDMPDAKKWYLTVNKYNKGSVDVYEKRGFVKTRAAVTDIGSGYVMDDYIMEKVF